MPNSDTIANTGHTAATPARGAARAATTTQSGVTVIYATGAGGSVIAGGYYDVAERPILDHAARVSRAPGIS